MNIMTKKELELFNIAQLQEREDELYEQYILTKTVRRYKELK